MRFQLRDKPIYVEAFRIVSLGPVQYEQTPEVDCLELPQTDEVFSPWREATLESGDKFILLEASPLKEGDLVKYDVRIDDYILFNFSDYPQLVVCND